jgi:hypothetical protein
MIAVTSLLKTHLLLSQELLLSPELLKSSCSYTCDYPLEVAYISSSSWYLILEEPEPSFTLLTHVRPSRSVPQQIMVRLASNVTHCRVTPGSTRPLSLDVDWPRRDRRTSLVSYRELPYMTNFSHSHPSFLCLVTLTPSSPRHLQYQSLLFLSRGTPSRPVYSIAHDPQRSNS